MLTFNKFSSLFFYGLLICVAHILWFNFVPLLTLLQSKYSIDESTALLSIAVFPIFYVLLSLHAGKLIDKYDYKQVISISALMMSLFALLRFNAENFWWLLFLQSAIAICQPYLINGISKFVADWFSKDHSTLVTSILSLNIFLGMAIGAALTPVLISEMNFENTMLSMGVLSLVSSVAFILFANSNPANSHKQTQNITYAHYLALFKQDQIKPLLLFAFLSLGTFNALSTWMESIYLEYGLTLEQAGMLTGLLIIGGIFGGPIFSALADRFNNRTVFLVFCPSAAALLIYPLCQDLAINTLMVLALLTGFVFLPGLPILLAQAEDHVPLEQSGIIASFVLWVGNLGAFAMIIACSVLSDITSNWQSAVYLMLAALVISSLVVFTSKASTQPCPASRPVTLVR